jgi:hypothetical protein
VPETVGPPVQLAVARIREQRARTGILLPGARVKKLSDPEEHASKSFEDDQRQNQTYYESAYDRWA